MATKSRRPVFLTEIASPATLLSAVLERTGIPRDADPGVPPLWLGRAMAAYKGGRCEAMLPGMIVPVRYVDVLSAHPVVGSLIGAFEHLAAERIEVLPFTEEVQEIARTVTMEHLRNPEWWRRAGTVLCRIRPRGDILPVQARYVEPGDLTVGLNPTWSDHDRWVMLFDVAASIILTGRIPEILEAIRFTPGPPIPGLRRVSFRGTVLDPHDDLFRQLVEERLRAKGDGETLWAQFLKVMENSLYGLFAQYNEVARGRKRAAKLADVWDGNGHPTVPLFDRHTKKRIRPEEVPGPFFRPWLAAGITAGTRLLLAMLEVKVRERGGTVAAADTDSATIVASPEGGLIPCPGSSHRFSNGGRAIRALSIAEMDEILAWFRPLSPVGADVWKLEGENTPPAGAQSSLLCLSYGPKRYVLFFDMPDGHLYIAKASAHALTVRPPRGMTKAEFLRSAWEALIRYERGDRQAILKLPYTREIAIGELPLRSASVFRKVRSCLPELESAGLLPFGALIVAYQAAGLMTGGPRMSALPVAPWTSDPLQAPWIDFGSGDSVDVISTPQTDEEWKAALAAHRKPWMIAATYADVLRQHREGTEYKYVAHNGRPATLRCGLLRRRPVFIERSVPIGKESRLVEEAQAGVVPAEAMDTIYEAPGRPGTAEREAVLGELRSVLPILRPLSRKWLAKRAGVSEKSKILSAILNGRKRPGVALANRLAEIARAVQQANGDLVQATTLLRRRAS